MKIQRGMRDSLEKYIDKSSDLKILLSVCGNSVYDYTCFGLDSQGKLSDDSYMIFYNQIKSPHNEIQYQLIGNYAEFNIRLNSIPKSIDRLVFTVSIDGNGTMGTIENCSFLLKQKDILVMSMELNGKDFNDEKAIIFVEFYRKADVWRFAGVARGFNGGLSELLKLYGGEEITHDNTSSQSAINTNNRNTPTEQTVSAQKKTGLFQ